MRKYILYILAFFLCIPSFAGSFRAAWIATVANIDWPSKETVGQEQMQQREMIAMLDSLQALHFNAIIFQVRPTADALYHSELEPRSEWIGAGDYDPLEFVLREAHLRDMEVHVWLNPYRVTLKDMAVTPGSLYYQHPEWYFCYAGQWYMNPGLEETQDWICSVVEDICCRYPVDAIHMDDYFYPYPAGGKPLPDEGTFIRHSRGYTDIRDWRRDNVNQTVFRLSEVIRTTRPDCRFGISPFGVWRNKSTATNAESNERTATNALPEGSATQAGITNYDDLYADILLWLREGWIDYVAPQLYWEIGKKVADYEVLVHWWAEHCYGRDLYIGMADYRLGTGKKGTAWNTGNEIVRQMRLNRTIPEVTGECFYSARPLLKNPLGICDSLKVIK